MRNLLCYICSNICSLGVARHGPHRRLILAQDRRLLHGVGADQWVAFGQIGAGWAVIVYRALDRTAVGAAARIGVAVCVDLEQGPSHHVFPDRLHGRSVTLVLHCVALAGWAGDLGLAGPVSRAEDPEWLELNGVARCPLWGAGQQPGRAQHLPSDHCALGGTAGGVVVQSMAADALTMAADRVAGVHVHQFPIMREVRREVLDNVVLVSVVDARTAGALLAQSVPETDATKEGHRGDVSFDDGIQRRGAHARGLREVAKRLDSVSNQLRVGCCPPIAIFAMRIEVLSKVWELEVSVRERVRGEQFVQSFGMLRLWRVQRRGRQQVLHVIGDHRDAAVPTFRHEYIAKQVGSLARVVF
mmetsp:Transcript_4378/g.10871  ORF Transcript_4378/g.10871 Transcript_4378/m.10871 type:complete len:358 (-) Transcript_4378:493-1566(-)|eukprot:scaffold92595_cov62-Phaeocystis_antarctica.AAC.3